MNYEVIPGTNLPRLPYGSAGFEPRMDYIIPQWEERTSYGVRRVDPTASSSRSASSSSGRRSATRSTPS